MQVSDNFLHLSYQDSPSAISSGVMQSFTNLSIANPFNGDARSCGIIKAFTFKMFIIASNFFKKSIFKKCILNLLGQFSSSSFSKQSASPSQRHFWGMQVWEKIDPTPLKCVSHGSDCSVRMPCWVVRQAYSSGPHCVWGLLSKNY